MNRGLAMRTTLERCLAAAASLALMANSALAADKLAPNDIQSTFFNGQPFTASTTSNLKFKMTFTADGKMKRLPIGTGARGEGTWKLSKDSFCTTWGGQTIANCFTLVAAGDNKWSVMRGSTIQAIWTK
jgi:hypothetical protein